MRSMVTPRGRAIFLAAVALAALAGGFAVIASRIGAEEATRATRVETADEKRWQAVAPGRVEPSSGEIKIAAPVVAASVDHHATPSRRNWAVWRCCERRTTYCTVTINAESRPST